MASHARSHITYEQNQIWPRLADQLDEDDNERLARLFVQARSKAPTRPHPHTPPVPAVLVPFGHLMSVVDRSRERLTGRRPPVRPIDR